jgi:hypothetical protein
MKIKTKIQFVSGAFDTKNGNLICIPYQKYGTVQICFKSNMNVPFAEIKLFTRDLAIDADAVFRDASKLGEEICRRWNECKDKR